MTYQLNNNIALISVDDGKVNAVNEAFIDRLSQYLDDAERDAIASLLKAAGAQTAASGTFAESELSAALNAVRVYRGVEDTVRRAEEHAAKAAAAIAPFPDCQSKADLLAAAEFSVQRDR